MTSLDDIAGHIYLITWRSTNSLHHAVYASDTPMSQRRLDDYNKEGKKVSYYSKPEQMPIGAAIQLAWIWHAKGFHKGILS